MSVSPVRRRLMLAIATSCGWMGALRATASRAANELTDGKLDPLSQRAAIITAGASIRTGRVSIDTPRLADNGHSVPITVRVDCIMTAQEFVRRIVLISESNPRPMIETFHLNAKSGRAEIATRIRLNKTQRVMALAELSDGSFWADRAEVIVTESACLDAE